MELASGFIVAEAEAEDRTYDTWKAQLPQTGWTCHGLVSDEARALIKLATAGLGTVSVADYSIFHTLRNLGRPLG